MRQSRKRSALALAILCLQLLPAFQPFKVEAQVRQTYDSGAVGLGQLLRRLQTTASAMHTGAHPDDEDTALIARLARGDQARVAYLSLNRGEGGQNIIGAELFEPLGVIRTEELLQARRLDGGEQFFTRTFDYGFSKTRAEAAAKWGEQNVLGDMVRAIRTHRPLVIASRFSGTPADGHGHHQLAGYLTPLAFRAAADPNQFPEQLKEGLRPWQARKLYVAQGFRDNQNNAPTLRVETGTYDPLIGRSYFEIAMEGRSQHKSQEMGTLELRGAQSSGLRLVESLVKAGGADQNIFDGIDTSIRGISGITGLPADAIGDELSDIEKAAARALAEFDALAPQKIIQPLAEGLQATRAARTKLATESVDANARFDADFLLAHKEAEFTEALRRAAGVTIDALAGVETIAPGESLPVTVRVFMPAASTARITDIQLRVPAGWRVERTTEPPAPPVESFRPRREAAQQEAFFKVVVPQDAPATQPYWLALPRDGYLFRWPDGAAKNVPFATPLVSGEVKMEIGGARVSVGRPAEYRYADGTRGEIRRDLNVVPALTVALDSDLVIAPSSRTPQKRRVSVLVTNNGQRAINGQVDLHLPAGWSARPATAPLTFARKGERTTATFEVTIPGGLAEGSYKIGARAVADGQTYNRRVQTIAYPHIQTHRTYSEAQAVVRVLDLKVVPVNLGYVMGSGDEVPDAIKRMGLDVTLLNESDLSNGDLTRFDTIVVGARASEVRPDFVANSNRLIEFVRAGGTLIVQYQRPDYVALNLAPYPAKMAARVTDESAPVTVLQPQHQAFNYPNKITEADWQDWVQERSLYNFNTFDPRYVPLLESHDPGEEAQRGGQVYAEVGRGKYVYTSYAWFRQLPSGVPGAYRLFANLISLSKKPGAGSSSSNSNGRGGGGRASLRPERSQR